MIKFILFIFLNLIFININFAEKLDFNSLNKEFFSLRNTDQILKEKEWKELAVKFEDYYFRYKDKNSLNALFNASICYQKLYSVNPDLYSKKIIETLNQLSQDHAGERLIPKVLYTLGDFYLFTLSKEKQAIKAYQEITDLYPDSNFNDLALKRINKINGVENNNVSKVKDFPSSPLVVIDPGHGGEDYGARGKNNLFEKDLVLDLAFELEKFLHAAKINTRLTRRSDKFLPLFERNNLANDYEADIFVSLHINASEKGNLSGHEVYYLDTSNDESVNKLAERENESNSNNISPDLALIISDLIQDSKLEQSKSLAKEINESLDSSLNKRWKNVKNLGIKKGPFYVLVGAHMPCVLVELFFINNEEDAKKLLEPTFRVDLAKAVFDGIKSYLKLNDVKKR